MKFIVNFIQVLWVMWGYLRPIYRDLMRITKDVADKGLESVEARKAVFQDITDCIQARGLEKIPDSVLNCSIELCYQIYIWQNKKEIKNV
jgi:hypothetical protein